MITRILAVAAFVLFAGCVDRKPSSDDVQREQQETILKEGSAQVGMPNIKNFREKKLVKDILERRDQNTLLTYTYLYNEMTGKLVYYCDSVGYAIPYATQFTNPQKAEWDAHGYRTLPQADPNGLFSPAAAEGSWVLCINPETKQAEPEYIEPRVVVKAFPARADQLQK